MATTARLPALEGLVALAAGLGAGHAASGFVAPGASPLLAVANRAVDLAPTPVKEWAVATFGTADKAMLLMGVIAVAAVLGLLIGGLGARSFAAASAAAGALGAICLAAALADPASGPWWAVPSVVAAAVGIGMLAVFDRLTAGGDTVTGPALSRRRLFATAAGSGVALAGLAAGEVIPGVTPVEAPVLPWPDVALPPRTAGLEADVPGVTRLYTPNADFYRVDTALSAPRVDFREWSLTVGGMVTTPLTLGWDDLLRHELVEADITMLCVSNPVGGPYVGAARWLGVRVADVLARAQPDAGADMVLSTSVDGFTISTPLGALTDDRGALLAIGMNGEPLPREHGAPVRLVTPGLYGYVGSTKWVTRLTLTTFDRDVAYWTARGWAARAPIKPASRIDLPREGARLPVGAAVVAGVAWAPGIGVTGVEVSVDGGPWAPATLGPDAGIRMWRQWTFRWDATPGEHRIAVRVADAAGRVQPDGTASPFPDGADAHHTVRANVG